MIQRSITPLLQTALAESPVVLLNGARQTGKSTLVQWLVEHAHPARYVTLDDATVLEAITKNPSDFLAGIEKPIAIDEVQRAPELFLAIKREVDKKRTPGRFLLTGSANVLLLPRLSESLAGRMEILTLWTFSQSELVPSSEIFVDALFSSSLRSLKTTKEKLPSLMKRILSGGYPEVQTRTTVDRKHAWFSSYITTILQRDIRDLAHIEGLTALPRLIALLAARAGTLLNFAELSNSAALPQTTLKRYMTLLQTTYLIHLLPAWSSNLSKRLIKTPKVLLTDTGLMTYLLRANEERLSHDSLLFGRMMENFVMMELLKQSSSSKTKPNMFHYRTTSGQEIDLVLETPDGKVVGVEVKTSSVVRADDVKTLFQFSELLGKRFLRGIVLYTGSEVVPFAKNIVAMPISALWS